ncbi:MAG: hypothetical protein AAB962_00805, partial [Patescibacteria group bacterium]
VDAALAAPEPDQRPLPLTPERVSLRVFLYALNIMRAASGLHAVQQTVREALETELKATLAELTDELTNDHPPSV